MPTMDNATLLRRNVENQLKYYLSDDNLQYDEYLRSKMDLQGFVDIELLASFKRLKSYTTDIGMITDVLLKCSDTFEMNDNNTKVRPRNDPLRWLGMKQLSFARASPSNVIQNSYNSFGGEGGSYAIRNMSDIGIGQKPYENLYGSTWIQNGSNGFGYGSYGIMGPGIRADYGTNRTAKATWQNLKSAQPFKFNPDALEFIPMNGSLADFTGQHEQSEFGYTSDSVRANYGSSHSGDGDSGGSLSPGEMNEHNSTPRPGAH